MRNYAITLLVVLSTTFSFSQKSENPYDFDESQYGYKTQRDLGLTTLKHFEEYNEADYIRKFLFSKEIFSYAMYEYVKKKNMDFDKINFEEAKDQLYTSMLTEHKNRVNSILEKIKRQNVELATTKIDSSTATQDLEEDIITGKISIYLSDDKDNYRFEITGLNKIKGVYCRTETILAQFSRFKIN